MRSRLFSTANLLPFGVKFEGSKCVDVENDKYVCMSTISQKYQGLSQHYR